MQITKEEQLRRGSWKLRERFEQGEIDVDPDDDKLAAQLDSIKWGIDSGADQDRIEGRHAQARTVVTRRG